MTPGNHLRCNIGIEKLITEPPAKTGASPVGAGYMPPLQIADAVVVGDGVTRDPGF